MGLEFLHADHIGSQAFGFEPQRVNNALLTIVGLSGSAEVGARGSSADEETLKLALASFPIPKRTMGIIEVGYLNEKRKFAGNPTYDDLSVVYQDYVDKEIATLLWKWNFQVHNPENGKTGIASQYKKRGWVSLYSPDGETERQMSCIGIWPSGFDPGDIDMLGEDTVKITVTLTIDKAIPSLGLHPQGRKSF